jgi:hypothetical protein
MNRLCTGYAQEVSFMNRLCTGYQQVINRLSTGYAQVMHRLCTGYQQDGIVTVPEADRYTSRY